jgi:CBS domain containing-hemolysin-like protein
LRHIPSVGEQIMLSGYRFIVAESDGRSVTKVRVERIG